MKKIMIVEDEIIVRERLIEAINWREEQVVLAGEAENGMEALAVYKRTLPDIIFADIRMPVMDGIKFTERLKQINPQAKIVLLTAYSDFKYAQEAINLKVEKYILKYEMDSQIINKMIRELVRKIDEENNSPGKQSVLRRVLFETHSNEELNRMLNRVGIRWNGKSVYLCYVKNARDGDITYLCDRLKKESLVPEYRWVSEDAAVIFCGEGMSGMNRGREVIKELSDGDRGLLFIDSGTPVCLGDLQSCYFKMLKVLSLRLFFGRRKLISISILDQVSGFSYDEELKGIFRMLRERRYDDAIGQIRLLLGEKAVKAYDLEGFENCMDHLAAGLFEEIHRQNSDIGHSYGLGVFKEIRASSDMGQIIGILEGEIEKLKRMVNLGRKMYMVLNYIDENYQKDITLEELSEVFNWNPSYVSQMFRKEMKMTFKQYVNDLKIERAKELLLEGQLSVEQIAEAVGYSNVNYFYKVFKKCTGKKPREFV